MAPSAESHHHRNTTKTSHKAFKSRHDTKGALKEKAKGKIGGVDKQARRQTPHQQVLSKIERRNQAKQNRLLKHKQHVRAFDVFAGKNGAPKIVAIIPLCDSIDDSKVVSSLNEALDVDAGAPLNGLLYTVIERFKQRVQYVLPGREEDRCLEACRSADVVLFLLSAEKEVDEKGEMMIRSIEAQGVSNVYTAVQGLENIQAVKQRARIVKSLESYVSHFFGAHSKLFGLDASQDRLNLVRSFCTLTPKGIRWREDRSWMLVEDVQWPAVGDGGTAEVAVTAVVRGKGLKADRLVQLGSWGEFQISRICAAPLPKVRKAKVDEMTTDQTAESEDCLEVPTEEQDDMADLAPETSVTNDTEEMSTDFPSRKGVLLDDHHYYEDEETYAAPPPKRLPKGTSSYQAAWYLDDVSDSGSDLEEETQAQDLDMTDDPLPQDGIEGLDKRTQFDPTEVGSQAPPASEMFLDPSPADEAEAAQLAAFRSRQADAVAEDREFPDEIELHPNALARERLARYRGLKSLRTSNWETSEDKAHEPDIWPRMLEVPDYKRVRSQVTREALVGGVTPGTRVRIYLKDVPLSFQKSQQPLSLVSLLRHEHKKAALNFSITLSSSYPTSIKSKELLILQVGSRRLIINPIFSVTGNTPNNVHKFLRYLHPGQTATASFVGPVTWGAVPAVFLKKKPSNSSPSGVAGGELELVGTGTALPPDSGRVIAKRVILTGHPYKIHKKLVTLRYMFFNSEDVNWFKALPLFTRRGRSGFIKESLGTHGYFKATFDGKINPQDSVGVSLYKRVWPRVSKPFLEGEENQPSEAGQGMDVEP